MSPCALSDLSRYTDNLKAAVTRADRHEPGINRTYADCAAHYGTVVLPARPRKPRDKAKVGAMAEFG